MSFWPIYSLSFFAFKYINHPQNCMRNFALFNKRRHCSKGRRTTLCVLRAGGGLYVTHTEAAYRLSHARFVLASQANAKTALSERPHDDRAAERETGEN